MNHHLYLIIALGLLAVYLAVGWLRAALRCTEAQRDYRRELGKNLLLTERQDRLASEQLVRREHDLDTQIAAVRSRIDARMRPVGSPPAHSAPYTASPSPAPAQEYLAPAMIWNAASAPTPEPDTSCRASSYSSRGGGDFGGGGASSSWGSDSSSSSDSGSSSSGSSD